ncbi:hypothetical protein BDZ97DRAFT_1605550, partial [Flammula alnicola]
MRPNTPHAVFTLEHSVFEGGHFYATSTIRDTLYGLIHCFVAERYISNTSHGASRFLLRQMLAFYHTALVKGEVERDERAWAHVPNLETMDGFKELLTICYLGVLMNVLDFETYSYPGQEPGAALTPKQEQRHMLHDYNAMSLLNRLACTHARGLALDLLEWVECNYELRETIPGESAVIKDMHSVFALAMNRLCLSLMLYKQLAQQQSIEGAPNCTLEAIRMQLGDIFPAEHYLQ